MRPLRRVAAGLAAGVLLAGCGPAPSPGPGPSGPPSASGTPRVAGVPLPPVEATPVPAGLASFYAQRPAWTPCQLWECATASVPLDHDRPEAGTLTLPLLRARATAEPRLGAIFVNPGGPGVSGTSLASWFDRAGLEQFDIVGWDPRGVAEGARVRCLDAAGFDRLDLVDGSPDDPAEVEALLAAQRELAAACRANTAPGLLENVSTRDTARDLDILRAALGDERLNFYGASYGTLIGAWYAELYPQRVGRMVLDAPVDITGVEAVTQAAGFEASFRAFAAWCAPRADCGLGTTPDAVEAGVNGWLAELDARPLPVRDRSLTEGLATLGIAQYLYLGDPGFKLLLPILKAAREGEPEALLAAADLMTGREADGSRAPYAASGPAIRCADRPAPPTERALADWRAERAASPFGSRLGPDVGCHDWPAAPAAWVTPRGAGAPPILVVAATGDPATPYAWGQVTTATLASGVLLTVNRLRHATYGVEPCATAAVRDYLLTGRTPPPGTVCG